MSRRARTSRQLSRELTRGLLPLRLLELLSQRPTYGYQLLDSLRRAEEPFGTVGPSVLYPTLVRLTRQGLVRSFYGEESRGPIRKYYELTPKGRQAIVLAQELLFGGRWSAADHAPAIGGSLPMGD